MGAGTSCRSPDGAFRVTYNGWLSLSEHGSRAVQVDQSSLCCTEVMWAAPHTLLFDDDFHLMRLDPVTRKRKTISNWGHYVVSRDGRWIAGWTYGYGAQESIPESVGVLSPDGKTCLAVPHNSQQSDEAAGFTRDGTSVVVRRYPYANDGIASQSYDLVAYAISSLPAGKDC